MYKFGEDQSGNFGGERANSGINCAVTPSLYIQRTGVRNRIINIFIGRHFSTSCKIVAIFGLVNPEFKT